MGRGPQVGSLDATGSPRLLRSARKRPKASFVLLSAHAREKARVCRLCASAPAPGAGANPSPLFPPSLPPPTSPVLSHIFSLSFPPPPNPQPIPTFSFTRARAHPRTHRGGAGVGDGRGLALRGAAHGRGHGAHGPCRRLVLRPLRPGPISSSIYLNF